MEQLLQADKKYLNLIRVVSILIPVVVAVLLFIPQNLKLGDWVYNLPHLNALINSMTAILLVAALIAIKQKNIALHKKLNLTALLLGTVFLISYVLYHSSTTSTIYGDLDGNGVLSEQEGAMVEYRGLYLFFLLSHIALSIVVVPLVLMAFYFALSAQIAKHKKLVKWTFPVWLYVSITGVIVYWMISPYYTN
jgi:putative membrane protein